MKNEENNDENRCLALIPDNNESKKYLMSY